MNLLPVNAPENIELLLAIGSVLADKSSDKSQIASKLSPFKTKKLTPEAAQVIEAIESLLARNHPFRKETLVQDVKTEMHYLPLYKRKVEECRQDKEHQSKRLKGFQDELTSLNNH